MHHLRVNLTHTKHNRRIVDYARKGIEQLTLLAEKLPEEELRQVFNKETLGKFFANVLFKVESNMDPEKRRRILGLWGNIIFKMGGGQFATYLAPEGQSGEDKGAPEGSGSIHSTTQRHNGRKLLNPSFSPCSIGARRFPLELSDLSCCVG